MSQESYEKGLRLCIKLVSEWNSAGEPPRFVFPPEDLLFIADLQQCGDKLALNDTARDLVALLILRCRERLGKIPTSLMLLVALEEAGHTVERKPFEEFGFEGKLVAPSGVWS